MATPLPLSDWILVSSLPRTGLTACNIASNRPIVDLLGTLPLDAFLANNPPPRLIVFRFGPETFYRSKSGWEHNGPGESLMMLIRNVPMATTLGVMFRHPAEVVPFESFVLKGWFLPNTPDSPSRQGEYARAMTTFRQSGGLVTLNFPTVSACTSVPMKLYGPVDAAWVRELRDKYQNSGTSVLVTSAPVPDCDPQVSVFIHDLSPFIDGDVARLPVTAFLPGFRHVSLDGARLETTLLDRLIAERGFSASAKVTSASN